MRNEKDRVGLRRNIVEFKSAVEKLAGLLAGKHVRVVFRGSECHTDGKTVTLPALDVLEASASTDDEIRDFISALVGYVDHEVGHILFSDMDLWRRTKINSQVRFLANAIEDAFVERRMAQLWRGSVDSIKRCVDYTVGIDKEKYQKLPVFGQVALMLAFVARGAAFAHLRSLFSPEVVRWVDANLDEEIRAATYDVNSTRDSIKLAEAIYEKVRKAFEEKPKAKPEPQKSKPQKQGQQDEEQGQGQSQESQEENDDADGEREDDDEKTGGGDSGTERDDQPGDRESDDAAEDADAGGSVDSGEDDGDEESSDGGDGDVGGAGGEDEKEGGGGDEDAADPASAGSAPSSADEEHDGEEGDADETAGTSDDGEDADSNVDPLTNDGSLNAPIEAHTLDQALQERFKTMLESVPTATAEGGAYAPYTTEDDCIGPLRRDAPGAWYMMEALYSVQEPRDMNVRFKQLTEFTEGVTGPLKTALARVLRARGTAYQVRDLDHGRLDRRRLWRVPTITEGRPRVFKDEVKEASYNLAVLIAVNESGSMALSPTDGGVYAQGGSYPYQQDIPLNRIHLAAATSLVLGDVLQALNIKFGVLGHTTDRSIVEVERYKFSSTEDKEKFSRFGNLRIEWVKRFEDSWTANRQLTAGLFAQSNTYDAEVVSYAAQVLAAQRGVDRRVLIMIDDGRPQPGDPSLIPRHRAALQKLVPVVEGAGIEVVGVGMATDSVAEFYKDHIVVHNLKSLPDLMLAKLGEMLGVRVQMRKAL